MTNATPPRVELTLEEVATLRDLAHFYERSMGLFRGVVRVTSGSATRDRFRFVAQESTVLWEFAESTHREIAEAGEASREVEMTPRALIAFWGRVLASLNTKRSRRRLSASEVAHRESLEAKLAGVAETLGRRDRRLLQQEIATRRPVEAEWMRDRLQITTESV